MTHPPSPRRTLRVAVLAWAVVPGCIHNHYYGTVPAYPAGSQVVTGQVGPLCEVPVEGAVVTSAAAPAAIVPAPRAGAVVTSTPAAGPTRVVINQPYQPSFSENLSQSARRFDRWRHPNPDASVASIPVQGALADDTIKK